MHYEDGLVPKRRKVNPLTAIAKHRLRFDYQSNSDFKKKIMMFDK